MLAPRFQTLTRHLLCVGIRTRLACPRQATAKPPVPLSSDSSPLPDFVHLSLIWICISTRVSTAAQMPAQAHATPDSAWPEPAEATGMSSLSVIAIGIPFGPALPARANGLGSRTSWER
ncbi:hypothetical protein LZ30DRAFT_177662 [Colletotrichum cereale]|nr:hypothetical protein LZ30DRAFT_177662 [Colletotrichum cereale]